MTLDECPMPHWRDALELLCGNLLGAGISRRVYVSNLDPTFVVKWQIDTSSRFQNQTEWSVWQDAKASDLARWLAPIVQISPGGVWLVQRRTMPVTIDDLRKHVPLVPRCFTDLQVVNWGRLDGRIVCHDYGYMLTAAHGFSTRLKRARWVE